MSDEDFKKFGQGDELQVDVKFVGDDELCFFIGDPDGFEYLSRTDVEKLHAHLGKLLQDN